MRAFAAALDDARQARGLTWQELTAAINQPFEHVPSIPISLSTIRSMTNKRSVTSAVVLQLLRWMGEPPEKFLTGRGDVSRREEALPDVGPMRILRFDTKALYDALSDARRDRGMTWKQIASELPGFTESMLTNLAKGPAIGFPRVMLLTQWLERPAAAFMRGYQW
jgi:transcriptional regulator with XRE-family HTH domain